MTILRTNLNREDSYLRNKRLVNPVLSNPTFSPVIPGCGVHLSAPEIGVPSNLYFHVFFDVADYNDNGLWNTTLFRLEPPAWARRIHIEAQVWAQAGLASSGIVTLVAKLLRNYTTSANTLVSGTDVRALVGQPDPGFAGTGVAVGGFDFDHNPGDYYGWFVYATGIAGATNTVTFGAGVAVGDIGHGLVANETVYFTSSGALPSPLGAATTYYVQHVYSADVYSIATYQGGPELFMSGAGTGTHTRTKVGTVTIDHNLAHTWTTAHVSLR